MFSTEIKRRPLSYRNKAISDTDNWAEESLARITESYPYPSTLVTSSKTLEEIREILAQKAEGLQGSAISHTAEGAFAGEPGPVPEELEYAIECAAYENRPVSDFQVIQHKQGKRYPLQNIVFCPDPGLDTKDRDSFVSTYKFCTLHEDGPFNGIVQPELYPGAWSSCVDNPWKPHGPLPSATHESRVFIQWEYPFAAFTNQNGNWTAILHPNARYGSGDICVGNQSIPEDELQKPLFYWDILTNKTCLGSAHWSGACKTVMTQLLPVKVTAHFKDDEGVPHSVELDPRYAASVCHKYWGKGSDHFMQYFNHEDANPALTDNPYNLYRTYDRPVETIEAFQKSLSLAPLEIKEHFSNLHNEWKSTITQLSS